MTQAVAVSPTVRRESAREMSSELTGSLSPDQLKKAVAQEAERRKVIRDFVRAQLELDKDYGTIPVRGKTGIVSQSKPVLFKSGMEKIFSLFNVVSALERDVETIEMVGKPGLIAYKCVLNRNGQFIGEGRGACDIAEKGRVNDAIKIAEKRARMDACLNLGFSEYFTQDLEDLDDANADSQSLSLTAKETEPLTPAGAGWGNGEVRDMSVTVHRKEMKSSQAGTSYALLHTDQGVIKAWKNTFQRFETGKRYRVSVEASEWNGTVSLAVNRFYREISETEPAEEGAAA